jgi:hypothetical protein
MNFCFLTRGRAKRILIPDGNMMKSKRAFTQTGCNEYDLDHQGSTGQVASGKIA